MKIHSRRIGAHDWSPWFAWFPVRVSDNELRWLETVDRRIKPGYRLVPMAPVPFEYRAIVEPSNTDKAAA